MTRPASRLSGARHEPAQNFLVLIATKLMIRIAPTAMELVLLCYLFSEYRGLFFGLSLVLRKCHPFANDFSARVMVFHVRGSLAYPDIRAAQILVEGLHRLEAAKALGETTIVSFLVDAPKH